MPVDFHLKDFLTFVSEFKSLFFYGFHVLSEVISGNQFIFTTFVPHKLQVSTVFFIFYRGTHKVVVSAFLAHLSGEMSISREYLLHEFFESVNPLGERQMMDSCQIEMKFIQFETHYIIDVVFEVVHLMDLQSRVETLDG